MNNTPPCQISILSVSGLSSFQYHHNSNHLLVLTRDSTEYTDTQSCSFYHLKTTLKRLSVDHEVHYVVFLSSKDQFNTTSLLQELQYFLNHPTSEITLLLPYLFPPKENSRIDGEVRSFIISKSVFDSKIYSLTDPARYIYHVVNYYLNSPEGGNIDIVQVGKPACHPRDNDHEVSAKLNDTTVQITHKGPLKLLKRCLTHLNRTRTIPKKIEICFDDYSYKRLDIRKFNHIADRTVLYKNSPIGVGPFLARQYMVQQSDKEYIYLLDSDDIAIQSRFSKLMEELEERKLDLLGSHELKIDQIGRKLVIVRFPLNVNYALAKKAFHPMLHGTCIMTKTGFLKVGGYSTEGKFGYDTQFLLRAGFFLKIGNADDFLYLRFQRPNSLTTARKTMYGTKLRKFMAWRWATDFNLVYSGDLNLHDSSLQEKKHRFPFMIVEIKK